MAAHRYWRARGLLAYDGGATVELSEFWLIAAGSRVDASATLTSSAAPTVGSLSSLSDNDTATGCTLSTASVLTWDFGGSPAAVDDIRLGSADVFGKFLRFCLIEWSDDATTWTDYNWGDILQRPQAYGWPGARTLTTTYDNREWSSVGLGVYSKDPSDGRIISNSTIASRSAWGNALCSSGVRQFEVTRSTWGGFWSVGVWAPTNSNASGYRFWTTLPVDDFRETFNGLSVSRTAFTSGGAIGSDVFGFTVDFSTGTLTAYKNGVSLGVVYSDLDGFDVQPYISATGDSDTAVLRTNDFAYPIAGADPWTRATIAQGAPTVGIDAGKISNGGHELAYSGVIFVPNHRARSDFNFDPAARGRIVGTVKRKSDPSNIPLKRRVRLYRDRDGMLIRETWSDDSGNYQFDYIEEGEPHTVISHDYQHNYRAVAADNLTLANGGITLIAP